RKSRIIENVLVLQGGGSLGAFSCGVFKALVKKKIRVDIAAGTSIGAINAAIIAGSKSGHPEKDLEDFWMELAESNYAIIPDIFTLNYDQHRRRYDFKIISSASINAAIFGVPKMFVPRWNLTQMINDKDFFLPGNWTYTYDHSPLAKTLEKYIDYRKISLANTKEVLPSVIRLIITGVNVLTSEPLVFDSAKMKIEIKHLLASSGYPIYGFPWVEIENGVYAWDGSLLSNTPVREVIDASPRNDKHIFIVENYPREIDKLPSNMTEVEDRAKDIIFSDKTQHSMKMSKLVTRQIQLIEQLYDIVEKCDQSKLDSEQVRKVKKEYNYLIHNYGAEIHSVIRIIRNRLESPNILKNADFSPKTIKGLVSQGERKTMESLEYFEERHMQE
ncbi:MAG: patatin-like phospholipase family protein, partial [Nitrososphaeraceae archaeon]|nr:patatin-like phospholipase family protein [Nitrososphaeraceae archaeon]